MKYVKPLLLLLALFTTAVVFVLSIQAQKPTIPPLPDLEALPKSQPGATATSKPYEKRPDDVVAPTVTPRKYAETINLVTEGVSDEDVATFIIRKANGDYVEILIESNALKGVSKEKRNTMFKMSEGDKIITSIPPLSLMKRNVPPPPQQPIDESGKGN